MEKRAACRLVTALRASASSQNPLCPASGNAWGLYEVEHWRRRRPPNETAVLKSEDHNLTLKTTNQIVLWKHVDQRLVDVESWLLCQAGLRELTF